MDYLLKTEPSEYSFAELVKDAKSRVGRCDNPDRWKHLRGMKPETRLVIYETGDMRTRGGHRHGSIGDASNPRKPLVKIKAGKALSKAVPLGRSRRTGYSWIRRW